MLQTSSFVAPDVKIPIPQLADYFAWQEPQSSGAGDRRLHRSTRTYSLELWELHTTDLTKVGTNSNRESVNNHEKSSIYHYTLKNKDKSEDRDNLDRIPTSPKTFFEVGHNNVQMNSEETNNHFKIDEKNRNIVSTET